MTIFRAIFMTLMLLPQWLAAQSLAPLAAHNACKAHITRQELQKGIPRNLLVAITKVESGRWHKERKEVVAWPWTVNAEGEGHYYATKEEAVAAVRKLMARGIKSIDVGCAQINLRHHKDAFRTLEEAFDPRTNVEYAADFLLQLKNSQGSWTKAVAYYHSATPAHHIPYARKVYDIWKKERQKGMGAWYAEAQNAGGLVPRERAVWGRNVRVANAHQRHLVRQQGARNPGTAFSVKAVYTPSQTKATLARYRQAALNSYRKTSVESHENVEKPAGQQRPVWGKTIGSRKPLVRRALPSRLLHVKSMARPKILRPMP